MGKRRENSGYLAWLFSAICETYNVGRVKVLEKFPTLRYWKRFFQRFKHQFDVKLQSLWKFTVLHASTKYSRCWCESDTRRFTISTWSISSEAHARHATVLLYFLCNCRAHRHLTHLRRRRLVQNVFLIYFEISHLFGTIQRDCR